MVKKRQDVDDPEVMIEEAIGQGENFVYRNGKKMIIALACITVLVVAVFAVKYLYLEPQEEQASSMSYLAQIEFANGSYETALNGGGNSLGFLDVIAQYGSTKAGNIANHYAGICYMQLGEYENAIKYLSAYSPVGGGAAAEIIDAQNRGLVGDAKMQLGDDASAVKMYEQAVSISNNNLTAPYYIKKAALAYQKMGNGAKALELYTKIKQQFPSSMEARDIDKYIGQVK